MKGREVGTEEGVTGKGWEAETGKGREFGTMERGFNRFINVPLAYSV